MIIIFHCLTNFLYHLFKKHIQGSKFTITKLNSDLHPLAQRDAENDIKFDPPVFKQRYERVTEVLLDEKWKNEISKVVDFGCAEFGLFVFLKNLAIGMREITFVDIDEPLLRDYMFRVYPLNGDHLVQRPRPLTVRIFVGSVSDPDPSLLNTDAVIAVELIEHLYPDTLEALPYNIFSFVQPKLALFTTPNSEFNVLFEKVNKFRHADHKFEWNREQFESWAINLTLRFPNYMVLFDGIGLGPDGSEDLGSCSQLAVFIRKDIICDNYIRETIACVCKESTCRSLDSLTGVCCYCNCVNCMPKYSYGICTYYTSSKSLLFNYESDKNTETGYYKHITTIEYPYDHDTRTQEEIIIDELKYRLHTLGRVDGNYYDFEKNRSLIPLSRLVYKTSKDFISETEARTLLLKFNFQIEECVNEETEAIETCVIYEPEMDNSGSGSNTEASGYESDNKYTGDEAQFSDWEENDVSWTTATKKDESFGQSVKTELHLEVGGNKKQQEALFDSGYQKSPSAPDESPQLPAVTAETIPIEFKINSDRPNRLSNILSVFDNFDKINELDAVKKDKKFFNFSSNLPHREVMKKICQEIVKHPIAGPSRDTRRRTPKKSQSSDSDDSTEDVKSITTCILENSLNKIECREEERHRGDIIQELIQEEPPVPQEELEPVLIVENGDLANNNRDREGNNYPPEDDQQLQIDNAIDNLELNNVNIDNNNEVVEVIVEDEGIEEEQPIEEILDENVEIGPPVDVEVAWSSREALFDSNSQVDLLDDFEMDGNAAVVNGIVFPGNFVVVTNASNDDSLDGLPLEESNFPNWLLQIFDENESVDAEDDMHDEPHFYCQGDGLGVHPSTVAINDDDDDDGNESGSDSSSSSGSVDFANAENSTSIQQMFIAPSEPRAEDNLVVVGQPISDQNHSISNPEAEEVFENAEEAESNIISSTQ